MVWDGIEKRKFRRVNFPSELVIFTPDESTICTHTENVSGGGARVFIEHRLGALTDVDLHIYLESEPIVCKGRIVWVKRKEGYHRCGFFFFDMGIEFRDIEQRDVGKIKNMVDEIVYRQ